MSNPDSLLKILIDSIFMKNILLVFFLGMCSFLVCSKKIQTAMGLGLAVIFVLAVATPLDWLVLEYVLKKGALAWTGVPALAALDLSFLTFISFIAVIAAMVQLVEMIVDRYFPALYASLGVFLPLITVNCAILGASLLMVERNYNLAQTTVYGIGSGIGWWVAILALSAIRQKLEYSNLPRGLRGTPGVFIISGFIAMTFMAFGGM